MGFAVGRRIRLKKTEIGALLAVALGCSACGGAGASGSSVPSPYAGTYYGEYIDKSGNAGTFQVTVAASGSVNGLFSNAQATYNLMRGSIGATGAGEVTYGTTPAKIQFGPSGQQTTQLNIEPVGNNVPAAVAVLVVGSTAASGANPFAGNFAGAIHDTTVNLPGALALNIDQSGTVSGLGVINVSGTPTLTSILGTVSSSGTLSYVEGVNQVTVSGTVTKGVAVYGPVQLSNGDTGSITVYPYPNTAPPPAQRSYSR